MHRHPATTCHLVPPQNDRSLLLPDTTQAPLPPGEGLGRGYGLYHLLPFRPRHAVPGAELVQAYIAM
ncbi:hypothetical protein XAP412_540014 [Xanthomonas phaseoli pv. phaseoli]|uniref:Uncharacterized protein n=1 Tax=Xanthomonas campestris pv. phaseoli TaxID=317013 RepID=A0AB38E2S4_XANCH|nr:hypothetical protein XAP6984_590015 [Xanthomonas phaseoli pv. phaseoli]SON87581.1 hypothetical protein XAP412_540014 [Xanthomonas phaseoli pv. phaseoli]SON91363.1 hypothetical protein XAP7430_550014 [Xanthomonas phaseoli pv. phaseoli]